MGELLIAESEIRVYSVRPEASFTKASGTSRGCWRHDRVPRCRRAVLVRDEVFDSVVHVLARAVVEGISGVRGDEVDRRNMRIDRVDAEILGALQKRDVTRLVELERTGPEVVHGVGLPLK